jgi:hypothetical protein
MLTGKQSFHAKQVADGISDKTVSDSDSKYMGLHSGVKQKYPELEIIDSVTGSVKRPDKSKFTW